MGKNNTFNIEERLNKLRSDELKKAGGNYNIETRLSKMRDSLKPTSQKSETEQRTGGSSIRTGSVLDLMQKERDAFEQQAGYSQYRKAADFTAKSGATGSKRSKAYLFAPSTWRGKGDLYDFINDIDGYREHIKNTSGPSRGYGEYEDYTRMNSDEIAMYNYLYNTKGQEGADEYLDALAPTLSQRSYDVREKVLTRMAKGNSALMSAVSVPTAFVGNIMSGVDFADQTLRRALNGEAVDYNSAGQRAGAAAQILRSQVGEDIENDTDFTIGGKNVARFLYDTAMSGADSLAMNFLGGGAAGGGALLGLGAATSQARDIAARGGNDNQALVGGIMAGVFEGLFEKISLGNWKKMQEVPVAGIRDVVKNIAKSMGVNASEEAATEMANLIFDRLNMGDLSQWDTTMAQYEAQGMSPNEARRQTIKDMAGQVLEAGISGGLMGLGFGGMGSAQSAIASRAAGAQVQDIEPLVQAAREMQEGSNSRKLAASIGENPSKIQTGAMYRTLAADMAAENMKQGMSEEEAQNKAAADIKAAVSRSVGRQAEAEQGAGPALKMPERAVATPRNAVYNDSGAEIGVSGISSVEDGKVYVAMEDGGVASVEDITFDDPSADELYGMAAKFDTQTAKTFTDSYDGSMPVGDYYNGFVSVYGAARAGGTVEQAVQSSVYAGMLPAEVMQRAYAAGQNAGELTDVSVPASAGIAVAEEEAAAPAQQAVAYTPAKGKKGGVVRNNTVKLSSTQENHVNALDMVFKAIGRTVNLVDSLDEERGGKTIRRSAYNASFDSDTNTYTISVDGIGEAYMYFAVHESIHDIWANNRKGFDKLRGIVTAYLEANGEDVNALLKAQTDKGLSEDVAWQEVVGNTVPVILRDPQTAQEFAERFIGEDAEARSVFKQLLDSILDFLNQAYEILSGQKSWRQMRTLEQDIEALTEIREAYFDALEGVKEAASKATGTSFSNKDAAYSGIDTLTQDRLLPYPVQQLVNWRGSKKIIVYESQEQYSRFIDEAAAHKIAGKKLYFGKISPDFAASIADATDLDLTGYNCAIQAYEIEKIFKSHGRAEKEIPRGQRRIGKPDLLSIPQIIANVDTITLSPNSYEGKPVIIFKKGGNGWTEIAAVVSDKHVDLRVQTMYGGQKKSLAAPTDVPTPVFTSEAPRSTAPINNIADKGRNSNPLYSAKDMDAAYSEAVKAGDIAKVQELVDKAALAWGAYKNSNAANEVHPQKGKVRVFYHGTNTGDFTVFDKRLRGSSSGDLGWFGKGFYFAFSRNEAATYGGHVMSAYLRMENPFDYSELYSYKGKSGVLGVYGRYFWVYNMARQFPQMVDGQTLYMYPAESDEAVEISWTDYANKVDEIAQTVKFTVEKRQDGAGETYYELLADPKEHSYTNEDGEMVRWTEYGMRKSFAKEKDANNKLNQICAYLQEVFGVELPHRRVIEELDFSGTLERAGYDGIIQSESGDEAVVFHPEQIKSTAPYTFDDSGNIVPLSKRFDRTQKDIRYSAKDTLIDIVDLREQNAAQAKEIRALTRLTEKQARALEDVRAQFKLTEGHKVSEKAVGRLARKILKEYSSQYDAERLTEQLQAMFEYIGNAEEPVWGDIVKAGTDLAKNVINKSSRMNTELYEHYAPVREYFKDTTVYLNESQRAEVEAVEGYNDFRRSVWGSVTIGSKKNSPAAKQTSLEGAWEDLSDKFPELFPADTTDLEMPFALRAAMEAIKPSYYNSYGMGMDDAAYDLFLRLYDKYFDMPEVKTFADKKAQELAMTKARLNNEIAQIREDSKARYDERLKKLRRENTAKRQELSRKYNEAKAAQHRADMARFREQYRRLSDKHHETLIRRLAEQKQKQGDQDAVRKYKKRIESQAKELASWLMRPTDKKHVPDALRNVVAEFLDTIDFSGTVKARDWRYRMEALAGFMENLDNAEGENIYLDVSQDFVAALKAMAREGGDLATMKDVAKLRELDAIMRQLKRAVQHVNTIIVNGRRQRIEDYGDAVIAQADALPAKYGGNSAAARLLNSGNIKPIYFFKKLGGPFKELFDEVREAQNKVAFGAEDAKAVYKRAAEKYHASKWLDKDGDTLKMRTERGANIELTRQQALSLYATYKRELANRNTTGATHLSRGGFVFADEMKVEKRNRLGMPVKHTFKDAKPKPMTTGDMAKVAGWLTREQKAFADELVNYMSTTMAGIGNTTSMATTGYKKFAEGYYFPYKSSRAFLNTEPGTAGQENKNRWKNWGSAKATQTGANNPIVLQDFTEVWSDHVNEMLMYAHMSVPQENLLRLFNYRTAVTSDETSSSVKSALQNAYGEAAVKYIDTLLADLGGNVLNDPRDNFTSDLTSKFKKGAVLASLSVAIQQPSAIVRAMALVNPRYFAAKTNKNSYQEAMKYAGTAVIKHIGGFDTGTGHGMADWMVELDPESKIKAFFERDGAYRDKVLGWLPGKMDEITWGHLWEAVKKEVADNTILKYGSEEHLKAAGKRFNDVVEYTQVYDSTLSRSELMRSKSGLAQMATSFMAEHVTAYNMLYDAMTNRKGNPVTVKRAVAAFIGAQIFNGMLKSIVYAMRDDDDQPYLEKYVEAFADSMLGGKAEIAGKEVYGLGSDLNPLNLIPYARDVMSLLQGYDVERADMSLMNDLISALKKFDSDSATAYEKWSGLAQTIAAMCGIPLKNVMRDMEAVLNTAKQYFFGSSDMEFTRRDITNAIKAGMGAETSLSAEADNLYNAFEKGDAKRIQRALTEIDALYKDKVEEQKRAGKTQAEAEKAARSSTLSACTRALKPHYLAATTQAEQAEIRSLALRIKIGNRQLYADYNFTQHWKE